MALTVSQTGKSTLTGVSNYLKTLYPGITLAEIQAANPQLQRNGGWDLIYPNDVINIPAKYTATTPAQTTQTTSTYPTVNNPYTTPTTTTPTYGTYTTPQGGMSGVLPTTTYPTSNNPYTQPTTTTTNTGQTAYGQPIIGEWINAQTGQPYSGPRQSSFDYPVGGTPAYPSSNNPYSGTVNYPTVTQPTSNTNSNMYGTWIDSNGNPYTGERQGIFDQPYTGGSSGNTGGDTSGSTGDTMGNTGGTTGDTGGTTGNTGDTGTSGDTTTSATGNPQLDAILEQLTTILQNMQDAGTTVNPNIELTPQEVQAFLDQAKAELDPYYTSYIDTIGKELSANLKQLQEQYDLTKEGRLAEFRENLANQRENEAGRGTIFSGGRLQRAGALKSASERSLQSLESATLNQAGNLGMSAEKDIGSANLSSLSIPKIQTSSLNFMGEGQYVPVSDRSLYSLMGGVYGTKMQERTTAERVRAAELEEAERKSRSLNFYN